MNSLPMVSGNPAQLLSEFKSRGGAPLSFALYGGSIGGRHTVIMPVVTDEGKGDRVHLTNFDLAQVDSMVRARIVSTAHLIEQIQRMAA